MSEQLRRVFMGSIPEAVQEKEIRAALSAFGSILTFHYNQAARGWALATFESAAEANAAVAGLNDRVVFTACQGPIVCRIANEKGPGKKGGQMMGVAGAVPNGGGFMYGAGAGGYGAGGYGAGAGAYGAAGRGHAGHHQSMYGMPPIQQPGVPEQPQPPQPTHWLTYYTPEGHPYYYNVLTKMTQWEIPAELAQAAGMGRPSAAAAPTAAAAAMNMMNPSGMLGFGGQQTQQQTQQQRMMMMMMGAGSAVPDPNFDPEALGAKKFGPAGCNLFVFHIPSEWSHKDLYDHFKFYGKIVSSRVKTEGSGRNLGYGFVSFEAPEAAFNAIKSMHGYNIGGKWLKVTLKKGEEHLLPPNLQTIYQRASGTIGGSAGDHSASSSHEQQQHSSSTNKEEKGEIKHDKDTATANSTGSIGPHPRKESQSSTKEMKSGNHDS